MRVRTLESLRILQGCTSRAFLNTCRLRLDICVCSIPLYLFLVFWLLRQSQRSYVYQRFVALSSLIGLYPLESHTVASLPLIIPLATLPLQTFPHPEPQFIAALTSLFSQILTIPLLPYRFPTQFLTHISSKVPFAHLPLLAFTPFTTASISGEDKVYLIATAPP